MFDSLEFKSLSFVKAYFLAALSTLDYFIGSPPQCRAPFPSLSLSLFLNLSWRLWSCDWLLRASAAAVLSAPVAARAMQLLLVVAVLSVPLPLFWGSQGVPGNRPG